MKSNWCLPSASQCRSLKSAGLICAATVWWQAAGAQVVAGAAPTQTGTSANPAEQGGLSEIVVTATRREERLQEVPLSVSVLSGGDLQQNHIQSFQDLSRNIAGFSTSNFGGPGTSYLQIRGMSSQAGTATVAIYLDDVSLTTRNTVFGGASEPRFFDVDRVEVLRGPQGTLFGASALGGAIRFISNQPKLDRFEGSVFSELSGTQSGGLNGTVRAIVNLPLVDGKVALRAGAEAGSTSGYIDYVDPFTGARRNDDNRNNWYVGRVTLRADLTEHLSITPALFAQQTISQNSDLVSAGVPGFVSEKPVREPSHDLLAVPSLTVNWDTGLATVTAVSSYYYRRFVRQFDETVFYVPYYQSLFQDSNPPLADALGQLATPAHITNTVYQFTQELRIASRPYERSMPFTWVAGAYYQNDRDANTDHDPTPGIRATFNRFGIDYEDPNTPLAGFPGAFDGDTVYEVRYRYKAHQISGFGEFTYYPLSNLRLTAGGRYISARDSLAQTQNYSLTGCGVAVGGPGCPIVNTGTLPSTAFTPKFAAGWDITPEMTWYGTVSKGFRLGGASTPIVLYGNAASPGVPAQGTIGDLTNLGFKGAIPSGYKADSAWNYETGIKSRLLDKRLDLNLSAFLLNWSNIQQNINLPISGFTLQSNAGLARIYGLESELRALVTRDLSAGLALGYTHARLPDGVEINGILLNGTTKNAHVVGVPDWTVSGNFEWRRAVSSEAEGYLRGSIQYIGKSYGSLVDTDADFHRPSYVTADASIGADVRQFNVSLFVTNLTNDTKIIQRPNYFIDPQGYRLRPRTVGANFTMKF